MVGDSAIGKTSLMVKYVEGAFDEDYIQTLGIFRLVVVDIRRQLHGEDHQYPEYRNHILDMGFRRSTRICQYASSCVQ